MVKYLQFDGVDDYLKTPSITFDEIQVDFSPRQTVNRYYIDARTGASTGYIYAGGTGSGAISNAGAMFSSGMYWNGVKGTSGTSFIPYNTRGTLRIAMSASATDDVSFMSKNDNAACMPGDIWSIRLLLGGVVKAFYDMSTGTVQDQSGNGNHATLNGGTWLDDGTGGTPTGTDGSTAFDLRQSLYSDGAVIGDTKQLFFAEGAFNFDSLQAVYSDSATGYDTRLSFYSDASTLFDTLQEFFSDGIVGSTPFDIRMVLYADSAEVFDSKQAFYTDGASNADIAQQFYQAGANSSDIKLVIYADTSSKFDASQTLYSDASVKVDTAQLFYTDGTIDFDTLQAILEDWNEYHEVIRLVLNITQSKSATLGITQRMQSELKM